MLSLDVRQMPGSTAPLPLGRPTGNPHSTHLPVRCVPRPRGKVGSGLMKSGDGTASGRRSWVAEAGWEEDILLTLHHFTSLGFCPI